MAGNSKKFAPLKDSTKGILERRLIGAQARESCIIASKVLCDSIRSTLGPRGMYKMLSEEARPFSITKDGSSVITGLIIEHPAARLIVEMAKAIEDETGDGTTSTIVLAGELINKAESLIDDGLHPVVIVEGYKKAARKAIEIARELAFEIEDDEMLKNVANTSLKDYRSDNLALQVVRAVQLMGDEKDLSYVAIEASEGKEFGDTQLIEGSMLHNWLQPGSPKRIKNAKICVLRNPVKLERAGYLSNIKISTSQIESHFEKEEEILRKMVDKVRKAGANVLICMQDIDVRAQGMLSMSGIMHISKILKYGYVKHICLSTDAKMVANVWDLKPEDIGEAGCVEERKVSEEELIFFENGKNPKACTFFIRGGTPKIIKEHKRSIYSSIHAVSSAIANPFVLPGGGAVESELAIRLKKIATSLTTKEQLAVMAFAEALEIIPKTLARNSGLDIIDTIVELTSRHQTDPNLGVYIRDDGETEIKNTLEVGIVDPLGIKAQMLSGAVEVAELILLADGILQDKKRDPQEEQRKQSKIVAKRKKEEKEE
ncbi:MAG: thermosome subunit alpha [Halobacteriota archaeon]|nr:thermosome subunit alpha [Halobacteriota archaeon]